VAPRRCRVASSADIGHYLGIAAARLTNDQRQARAIAWNGYVGMAPLTHTLPDGLTWAPLTDMPPSPLVVAWATAQGSPLIHSFTHIAADTYRSAPT
jgi:hypothetical protein